MHQDGTIGNMWVVITQKVNEFFNKLQVFVWYQYEIYLDEHRLVEPLECGTARRNKLKYPRIIDKKQW